MTKRGPVLLEARIPLIHVVTAAMPTPGVMTTIALTRSKIAKDIIAEVELGKAPLVLCVMTQPGVRETPECFYRVGVICKPVLKQTEGTEGQPLLILTGSSRARIIDFKNNNSDPESFWAVSVAFLEGEKDEKEEFESTLYRQVIAKFLKIKHLLEAIITNSENVWRVSPWVSKLVNTFENYDFGKYEEANSFTWVLAASFPEVLQGDLQPIIESTSLIERIDLCINVLKSKLEVINRYQEVNNSSADPDPTNNGSKSGKEKKDRADDNEDWAKKAHPEIKKRWNRFKEIRNYMSETAQRVALDDFRLLVSYGSPQGNTHEWPKFIRRLNLTLEYPWKNESMPNDDIKKVVKVLNEDHCGLDQPKQKICDQIAPRILNPAVKSQIICFVGAPGVGKTSLAKSIAKALGLKLIRISVGGIRDEAQVRGHSITYVGSQPGEVIREMIRAGVKNPVFVIDEIDKISQDSVGGNPAAALLEMLDPEQNSAFKDHYLDYGIDLSKVFFIATANIEDTIMPALRDRMDIIRLPGYLEIEKVEIAKRHFIPRWTKETGLERAGIKIIWSDEMISLLIRAYTREAGVRNLERNIATISRRLARQYLELYKNDKSVKEFEVTRTLITNLLGPEKFIQEGARPTVIGEAIGLVWTPVGGDIVYVQTKFIPRIKDQFTFSQTGLQGKVMNEANKVALTLVREKASANTQAMSALEKNSIHLHVPEGAISKDGPSAGITSFIALYSLVSKNLVQPSIAMTGEINLSGRVTGIGGVREKIVAADLAGIKEVIMPKDNERNLYDVPQKVKERLKFHFVETVDQVVDIAFGEQN